VIIYKSVQVYSHVLGEEMEKKWRLRHDWKNTSNMWKWHGLA